MSATPTNRTAARRRRWLSEVGWKYLVFLALTTAVGVWRDLGIGEITLATMWNATNTVILGAFVGENIKELSCPLGGGMLEEFLGGAFFDDPPAIHKHHAVRHGLGEPHLVCHDQHGHARLCKSSDDV